MKKGAGILVVAVLMLATLAVGEIQEAVTLERKQGSWLFGSGLGEMILHLPGASPEMGTLFLRPEEDGMAIYAKRFLKDEKVGMLYRLGNSYRPVVPGADVLIDPLLFDEAYSALQDSAGVSGDLRLLPSSPEPKELEEGEYAVTGIGSLLGFDSPELGHLTWVEGSLYTDSKGERYESIPGTKKVRKSE